MVTFDPKSEQLGLQDDGSFIAQVYVHVRPTDADAMRARNLIFNSEFGPDFGLRTALIRELTRAMLNRDAWLAAGLELESLHTFAPDFAGSSTTLLAPGEG